MPAEIIKLPERVIAELNFIETNIRRAVDNAGLSSSRRLCHQINWAIALRLHQSFGMGIAELRPGGFSFVTRTPVVGYVPDGRIDLTVNGLVERKAAHSFLVVFGLAPQPILIDGANDQADPHRPFIAVPLDTPVTDEILIRHSHSFFGETKNPEAIRRIKEYTPEILDWLFHNGVIDKKQHQLVLAQFLLEAGAGMSHFLPMYNRDWLAYFAKWLDIQYPSFQNLQPTVRKILTDEFGVRFDSPTAEDKKLAKKAAKLG